jgi:hypothetical protein
MTEAGVFVGEQQEMVGQPQHSMLDVMGKFQLLQLSKLSKIQKILFLVDILRLHGLQEVSLNLFNSKNTLLLLFLGILEITLSG